MEVTVTVNHQRTGMQRVSCSCPIALAIRDHFKAHSLMVPDVVVGVFTVRVGSTYYKLPEWVSDWIAIYDNSKNVPFTPFTFKMELR